MTWRCHEYGLHFLGLLGALLSDPSPKFALLSGEACRLHVQGCYFQSHLVLGNRERRGRKVIRRLAHVRTFSHLLPDCERTAVLNAPAKGKGGFLLIVFFQRIPPLGQRDLAGHQPASSERHFWATSSSLCRARLSEMKRPDGRIRSSGYLKMTLSPRWRTAF